MKNNILNADDVIDYPAPDREQTADAAITHLAVRENSLPATTWVPSFAVAVDVAIEHKKEKRRFFLEVMEAEKHYGVIPGTGTKPTLFKSGAEMLLANMGLNASLYDADTPTIDIAGKLYGEPYIRYRRACYIYRQFGHTVHDRMIVAQAEGSCSNWEVKYRYRNEQISCPTCGKQTVIKGKKEYGGGWLCFGKKGGCGAKFRIDDAVITGQVVGKVVNPDPADVENTILKMADKRALVAATLIATGCSDIFTQDVEDFPHRDADIDDSDQPPAVDDNEAQRRPTHENSKPATRRTRGKTVQHESEAESEPQPIAARVVTEAAKSKAERTRNSWVGRLTALEERLQMSDAVRADVMKRRYGGRTKRELTQEEMIDYGTFLNEQFDAMEAYYASLDTEQAAAERAQDAKAMHA